ncbi:MAG: hypothetical protein U1E05_20710, partial [Patescibacteria group bacterium]|nr:hypothetical protein [Patescibacteria group bacterium]
MIMCRFVLYGEFGRSSRVSTRQYSGRLVRRVAQRIAVIMAAALFTDTVDAATVLYEYNATGTPAYAFGTIAAPTAGDLGGSAAFFGIVNGTK